MVDGTNSLIGSAVNDLVGSDGVVDLGNGNYVVDSSNWGARKGAVTWEDALGSTKGSVLSTNSLVGNASGDTVGSGGVTVLDNHNYVVRSNAWGVGLGAVTWADGGVGVYGPVASSNSLLGGASGDAVGNGGIVALGNGNYVVISNSWGAGSGAVTWADGSHRLTDPITSTNSLVGNAGDRVGLDGVVVLSNHNYVVRSSSWGTGKGAVTWGNGNAGVAGVVGQGNSLVGSLGSDAVGASGITALGNGNYVVRSNTWNNSRGAVSWGEGGNGRTKGIVDASNSVVGSHDGDLVGSNGITVLTNNNYLVSSNNWNGAVGAVTWGNGSLGTAGVVDATNSLVGTQVGDTLGSGGVLALRNGNYVVRSPNWNVNRGAVTWGNGNTGTFGEVSATNSLIGSAAGDLVGSNFTIALSNGNYVIGSTNWNSSKGAVTWGDGTRAITGLVSADNSLVGSVSGDSLGATNNTYALDDGNYVVTSPTWSGNRGAATWGSGTQGVAGVVSMTNSLVGNAAGAYVGVAGVKSLGQGNYLLSSPTAAGTAQALMVGVPGNTYFATGSAAGPTMGFNPSLLTATLAGGTAVNMQASNDLTVNADIAVNGSSGGSLTLQAGRHLDLNSRITTANGNFSAAAGDPGAITADRQTGTPAITLGAGAAIEAGNGTVTLSAIGGNFVNNSGSSTPIHAARTFIYSSNPATDVKAGMALANKHYNQPYTGTAPSYAGSGDWFFYTIAPVLAVAPVGQNLVYGTYPGSFAADYSGFIDGDTNNTAGIGGSASFTVGGLKSGSNHYVVGNHEVSYSTGLLSSLGYSFVDRASSTNELTVTPLALTGTIATGSSVYGAALAPGAVSFSNALAGDNLGPARPASASIWWGKPAVPANSRPEYTRACNGWRPRVAQTQPITPSPTCMATTTSPPWRLPGPSPQGTASMARRSHPARSVSATPWPATTWARSAPVWAQQGKPVAAAISQPACMWVQNG